MTAWQSSENSVDSPGTGAISCGASDVANSEHFAAHEIAGFSDEKIESLTNAELCELIRRSEHRWSVADMEGHLSFSDRSTLLRLAFLVRSCCRNAECAARRQAEMDEIDGSLYRRDSGTLFGNPR